MDPPIYIKKSIINLLFDGRRYRLAMAMDIVTHIGNYDYDVMCST